TPARVDVGSTSMPGNVYMAGLGDLTLGTVRAGGSAALAVSAAGALTAAGPASGGDVSPSARPLPVTAAGSVTAGDTLAASADPLTLLGTLSAGSRGIVTVKPLTASRNIDLGGTGPDTDLVLSESALGQVTAGTLRIGDAAYTGDISVTGYVGPHSGYATLSLQTGGGSISAVSGATPTAPHPAPPADSRLRPPPAAAPDPAQTA